jgi:hypothetical protein
LLAKHTWAKNTLSTSENVLEGTQESVLGQGHDVGNVFGRHAALHIKDGFATILFHNAVVIFAVQFHSDILLEGESYKR